MPRRALSFAGLLALFAVACGGRGEKAVGEPCGDASECRHGLCVAGVAGEAPVCTRSCASTSECPRGWSCGGVTSQDVVICTQGAANPFGIGARE